MYKYLPAKFRCKYIIQSLASVGTSYVTSQRAVTSRKLLRACLQLYTDFIGIV